MSSSQDTEVNGEALQPAASRAWMERFAKFEERLTDWLLGSAAALLIASTSIAVVSVVQRYAFRTSFSIVEELCRFSLVYGVLLAFGPLIVRNMHLSMAILVDLMPQRMRQLADLVVHLFLTVLLAFLFVAAWQWEMGLVAMGMLTMSGDMRAWIPSAALPLGIAIAFVYAALRVVRVAGGNQYVSGISEQ